MRFAALGLVLLTGVGGLTSFGQAAFVGIGAYATAWYTSVHGGSPWLGLLLALVSLGSSPRSSAPRPCGSAVTSCRSARSPGALPSISCSATSMCSGATAGSPAFRALTIGPISLGGNTAIYFFIWALLGLVMLLCRNLLKSRQGRAIRSLRGGIAMVESLAIDSFRMRLAIFVLAGAARRAVRLALRPHARFVSPAPFDIRPGIEVLLMALVGGAGNIAGAVVGAAMITLLKNCCRTSFRRSRATAPLEIVVFGVLLSCCCRMRAPASFLSSAAICRRRVRRLPAQAEPLHAGAPRRRRPAGAARSSARRNGSAHSPPSTT